MHDKYNAFLYDTVRYLASAMTKPGIRDPLHCVTLQMMLGQLVERFGWQELGRRIAINCFTSDPGINSSLRFLRKTPWAREKVEALFLQSCRKDDE